MNIHLVGSSWQVCVRAFLAVVAVAAVTLLLGAPSAAASKSASASAIGRDTRSSVDCHVVAYLDTHNGKVWAAGYTAPAECHPVGGLQAYLYRNRVNVSDGAIKCSGQSFCSVASGSVGGGSTRHRWCARVGFYAAENHPIDVDWSCEYI